MPTTFYACDMRCTYLLIHALILLPAIPLSAQQLTQQSVSTSLGAIAVQVNEVAGSTPIIFLHGVYYDHQLWQEYVDRIHDRTVITLDMPLHGDSKQIPTSAWTLDDCADMLIEVLDELHVERVIAIGHSWGSMTILRAAVKAPGRFQAVGFCNMPTEPASTKTIRQFRLQHLLLDFRTFYTKQVAKSMYGKQGYAQRPELSAYLATSMGRLTKQEIKQTDTSVILQAEDATPLLAILAVPALALKGVEDYVPVSPHLPTRVATGGHVSPLEAPEAVWEFIQEVVEL
ncbi:MAG: alpha/beta hydrolase [Bacteroidota bacterium]